MADPIALLDQKIISLAVCIQTLTPQVLALADLLIEKGIFQVSEYEVALEKWEELFTQALAVQYEEKSAHTSNGHCTKNKPEAPREG